MQLLALQARAMEGTRPSIVTRALSTKTPNGRPRGDPCINILPRHRCLPSIPHCLILHQAHRHAHVSDKD